MDNLQFTNFQRAEVLTQALPYIKQYVGKTVVVKYGGKERIFCGMHYAKSKSRTRLA